MDDKLADGVGRYTVSHERVFPPILHMHMITFCGQDMFEDLRWARREQVHEMW